MGGTSKRLLVVLLATGAIVALVLPAAADSLGKGGSRARDCVAGEASLDRKSAIAIDFFVWCAVQSGEVRFDFSRPGGSVAGFGRRIVPAGPGAGSAFRCRQQGQTVRCTGLVAGPVILEARIAAPANARCAAPLRVDTAAERYVSKPFGCPGVRRERPPRDLRYMRGFRRQFGLDPDLHGDRAAIDRRIHALVRAWIQGEPVARVTTDELGLPLRPQDDRELEFRDEYREQTASILEHWAPRHAAATFAGWDFDHEYGGIFYIGFTGDQDAQLAAFKARFDLIAPGRIRPFPIPPTHSERELISLEEEVFEWLLTVKGDLFTSLSTNVLANKIEVGSLHVAKARSLLAERFGADAPIRVVREAPAIPL